MKTFKFILVIALLSLAGFPAYDFLCELLQAIKNLLTYIINMI